MLPIVDTHQHLWDLNKVSLPWLEGIEALNQNYLPSDYQEATKNQNVIKTVYMEVDVASDQKNVEVELITELCKDASNPMSGAVISGYPADKGFKDYLRNHQSNPFVKGLRQVLHVPDTKRGMCLTEDFVKGVQYLGEQNLLFSVCIRPAELEDIVVLAKKCPETTLILDHCGNADPKIINSSENIPQSDDLFWHGRDTWKEAMRQLGALDNVICKISGIIVRAPEHWTPADLAPTINHCLDSFGPNKVIFGGDWPVCTLGAPFDQWATALREIIRDRSEDEQKKLLSENAIRIYQL